MVTQTFHTFPRQFIGTHQLIPDFPSSIEYGSQQLSVEFQILAGLRRSKEFYASVLMEKYSR